MATCPHCHHELPENMEIVRTWAHQLTPGLVGALATFALAVRQHERNDLHLERDLELTYTQRANFTKLRFFGLVAKVRDGEGQRLAGRWLLTRRGSRFLRGEEPVHKEVKTLKNKVIERSPDKLFVATFRNQFPWFQERFTWEVSEANALVLPPKQLHLI